ncbi:protein lethal(2)essential for life-like [Belonocnema kinseyi]|uniref:protein lethal(2)essential for life-like n=1 Tax=Belonocnema kinseyi TaxID=2817044 RepID=UPI00143CD6CE|nr:protein lethal(2)essential for life-like [Belonocnema kinseyi]
MSSLMPMLYSDWWEALDHPHHITGQNFGHAIRPNDVLVPHIPEIPLPMSPYHHDLQKYIAPIGVEKLRSTMYLRPWVQLHNKTNGVSTVKKDKDKFQVVLEIQQFTPEEVSVKVVDKFVMVEGKHEDKQDEHGWVARQFSRKYLVPEQCDLEQVKSSLSSDGVLTITAPRKHDQKHRREKDVEIEITEKPTNCVGGEN